VAIDIVYSYAQGCSRSAVGDSKSVMLGTNRAVVGAMSRPISRPEALQQRLASHAAVILDISAKLPRTAQASHVSRQLLRSGTAAAANYGEARGAESRSDFIHKLRVVLKELNETAVWLQMIVKRSWFSPGRMSGIVAENDELCRIIAASIKTAGGFERT
jgi:four helix bundle protein